MDGENHFYVLYLFEQFPSAAFRLKDVRHYFISGVFELLICTVAVTPSMNIGSRLAAPVELEPGEAVLNAESKEDIGEVYMTEGSPSVRQVALPRCEVRRSIQHNGAHWT